jgi:hypothetical protein
MIFFLAGAALLPYALSQPTIREVLAHPLHLVSKPAEEVKKPAPAAAATSKEVAVKATSPHEPRSAAVEPRKAASTTAMIPFEQAFRWDVKPAWVLAAWPRVTTELSDLHLQGYRISYVSGTTESDLAGSLTYYFDGGLRLQKLTFTGSTGDAKRLVQFLTSQHRFERRLGDDPSLYLYQVEQDGQALSELRVKAAPIVRTGNPLRRFEVSLEMRRPEE